MLRLAFNITLSVGALIIGLVLVLWIYFVHTPPGRDFLKSKAQTIAQKVVREQLDSELTIGELENGLPGRIVLNDIVLSQNGEDWFRAENAVLVWNPFAMMNRKLIVREFALKDAILLYVPDLPESEEPEEDKPLSLPQELPWADIKRITVSRLTLAEGIAGPERTIRAEGRVSTADNRLSSDLTITTGNDDDLIRALVSTRRKVLTVDLQLNGTENGLINYYADAGGPITLSLKGQGEMERWAGSLTADAAQYGTAELDFTGDLARRRQLSLIGTATPGDKWPAEAQQAAGESIILDAEVDTDQTGRILRITTLEGAFGKLAGKLDHIQDDGTIRDGAIDMTLDLAPAYARQMEISPLAGQNILSGQIDYDADGSVGGTGLLVTPAGNIQFSDLSYNGEAFDAGLIVTMTKLPVDDETAAKLFPRGGQASATVHFAGNILQAENIDIFSGRDRAGAALALRGAAGFNLDTGMLDASGSANIAPVLVSRFTDAVSFERGINGRFTAKGTPGNLAVTVDTAYGAGIVSGQRFAAGALNAGFTGLPGAPQGRLSLAATDRSYIGAVELDTLQSNDIAARSFSFSTPLFSLEGQGRINPETLAARGRAALSAEDATLADGRQLSGNADLVFDIGAKAEGQPVSLTLESSGLKTTEGSVESLVLTLDGTLEQARFILDADQVVAKDYLVTELDSEGTVSIADAVYAVTFDTFAAKTGAGTPGETINLLSPSTVSYENGTVSFTETRISGFDRSEIILAGSYAPQRWVLDASGTALRIPGLQSPLTFTIDLDTDENVPAHISLYGEVQDQNDILHRLSLRGSWDGEQVKTRASLRDEDNDYPGQLDLTVPLQLVRGDSLSVEIGDGAIDGKFTYDAGIENILAFVPIDENFITGRLVSEITISGTVATPDINGNARLVDGRFEEPRSGAVLNDLEGNLDFAYNGNGSSGEFTLVGTDANGLPGTFRMEGDVHLGTAAAEEGHHSRVNGTLTLNRATLIQSQDLRVRASSDLALSGSLSEMLLEGTIDIQNFDAVIPDIPSRKTYTPVTVVRVDENNEAIEDGVEEAKAAASPLKVNLDLKIRADNEIYINGRGLQSEWRTDLAVTGTSNQPIVNGNIQNVDGVFEFAGRRFDITRGDIVFTGQEELIPRLDVIASYDVDTDNFGNVAAQIKVSGTAKSPTIALTSTPVLPQEDIMSLILFGRNRGQLSAYESLQIATSIASLTGTGPFGGGGITNSLRRSAGLDTLSFGQDSETGAGTLTVGKYVSDEVYISATQGLGDAGNSVSVSYEVNDHVTVETTLEGTGAQSVSANYKKDY